MFEGFQSNLDTECRMQSGLVLNFRALLVRFIRMRKVKLLIPLFFVLLTAERATYSQDQPGPKRVGQVDLHRYAGLWYEIARIPNSFQKQCARGVTAEYTLGDDGEIDVVNRCYQEDGRLDEAQGLARIEDREAQSSRTSNGPTTALPGGIST